MMGLLVQTPHDIHNHCSSQCPRLPRAPQKQTHFCPWDDTDGKTCHLASYSEEEGDSPAIQSQPLKAKG